MLESRVMVLRCRPTVILAVLASAAIAALVPQAGRAAPTSWQPEAPSWDVVTLNDVPVTMSDGVVLRANVGVPAPHGATAPAPGLRFPVLLTQTPYRKDGGLGSVDPYFVSRGYAMVVVDVRGTGSSEGKWDSFGVREQEDGPAVVRWAAHQPWANGSVGLLGASYLAINQFLTMEQDDAPSEVKAMFPVVPMSDAYRDVAYHGGNLDAAFIPPWLALVTALGVPPAHQAIDGNPQDFADAATVAGDHAKGAVSFQANVVAGSVTGGSIGYDGDFYKTRSPIWRVSRIHVPVFIVGGEFDIFQRGEPLLYNALQVPAKRLLIGPWIHLTGSTAASLPADGIPELHALQLQWFDQYVRGIDTGEAAAPRVLQYELRGSDAGHFIAGQTYPLPGMGPQTLYLGSGTSGSAASLNDGTLTATRPASAGSDPLPYVPTGTGCTRSTFQWGDASGSLAGLNSLPCETDERPQELQALTYTTPVLQTPVTLNGPINVHLVAESPQGRNITFSVRITDVTPSGQSIGITAGWLLASMRATTSSWVTDMVDGIPMRVFHPFTQASEQQVPVQATGYDIEVFPTFATFQAGHRIRLDISTGDVPHMAPSISHQLSSAGTVVLIDRDPANPSFVSLPVVPTHAATAAQGTVPSGAAPSAATGAAAETLPNTAGQPAAPAAIAAAAILPAAAVWARRRRQRRGLSA